MKQTFILLLAFHVALYLRLSHASQKNFTQSMKSATLVQETLKGNVDMIKKVDAIPKSVNAEQLEKKKKVRQDIHEIIDNRIEMCEITLEGYARSTWRNQVNTAVRRVSYEICSELRNEYGMVHCPNFDECFKITERKDTTSNEKKMYIIFDVTKYDTLIKDYKEEAQCKKNEKQSC